MAWTQLETATCECYACQQSDKNVKLIQASVIPTEYPTQPWSIIPKDIMGPCSMARHETSVTYIHAYTNTYVPMNRDQYPLSVYHAQYWSRPLSPGTLKSDTERYFCGKLNTNERSTLSSQPLVLIVNWYPSALFHLHIWTDGSLR